LCEPARYRDFARGVQHVGNEAAVAIGADATVVASKLRDPKNASDYLTACTAWSALRDGVHPTKQTAERLLSKTDPRKSTPQDVRRITDADRLRKEVARLTSKLVRAESQLAKVTAQRDEAIKRATMLSREVAALKKGRR
jgi:hypothetical protein